MRFMRKSTDFLFSGRNNKNVTALSRRSQIPTQIGLVCAIGRNIATMTTSDFFLEPSQPTQARKRFRVTRLWRTIDGLQHLCRLTAAQETDDVIRHVTRQRQASYGSASSSLSATSLQQQQQQVYNKQVNGLLAAATCGSPG